jgi:RHS repeat-associated protein
VVEELDGSRTAVARYAQGLGIDEPLAMYRGGASYYYDADGLGSITSLTNSSGQIAASYTYDSFGKLTASTGTVTNPFRYTGREYGAETGLYYYRARYYDSSVGRFISEDAVRFGGGPNFYEYVGNTPTNFVDPTGNCPFDLDKFVNWLDKHAKAGSRQGCAKYIRRGLEEGANANTTGHPVAAKNWGKFLEKHLGFTEVAKGPSYSPIRGDVAVFQPVYGDNPSNPYGHIEVWDGTEWVSDYKQGEPLPSGAHFYPNLAKFGRQPFKVYRCK